ncbi:glycosyltransferase [Robbsia sp. Bb-Pol-6]|uniref:Glycosyltransferase n=1 Tax=Robbsia betulipollinis TaxID=2981849 RepID=A0ABT3ZPR4_9BURK|nr:glycosyltransferase [Robbsia betulipollinis]MCY0387935.1 glycosyltransferase [Robbsia betulipollinis]
MRIGILTHVKHPVREPFAGGLEAFTYDMTLALKKRGHDVTLFASSGSAAELGHIAILDDENYGETGTRGIKEAFFEEYRDEHVAYMNCMQRLDDHRFDVVFNNSLHYVPVMMAPLIGTPMLTVLHTPPFFELSNAIAALRRTTKIRFATVSKSNARSWARWVPECDIIANGIDLSTWAPVAQPSRRHALWYGRLVPEKGAHLAMDAAQRAGLSIEIVGQASDETYFKNEIAPRLNEHAVYLGHLERSSLVSRVQHASVCLVTPCWDEPFGLVVAESLACGTPVAAFARGAIPDLLTAATGVTAPPGDVDALAQAAVRARELSRAECRHAAQAWWSQDLMLTRYERLLQEVATRRLPADA